jgi:CubicO group peptidase (beta-lactamase class C family)
MSSRISVVLVAAVVLAACGGGSDDAPSRVYDFSAFEQEIDRFIAEEDQVDGVGAILVDREAGVLFQKSFGAFTDDRVYLLASSSKMITAGVLMRLADDGLLDMDEPVVDVVGDWGDENPAITPAQLVSNSSGLVGLLQDPTYAPYLCQYLYPGTLQDCARIIFTTPLDDDRVIPPDTEFRYGGGQWQVAGAVAEIVSGKSWADLIREIYTEPCGLTTLGYNNHFVQSAIGGNPFSYPPGFDGDPSSLEPTDNPNMEGGAYSDIADYGKLLLMHLRGGMCGENRVLSEAAIRRMHEDRFLSYGGATIQPAFAGYGLGWWVSREDPELTIDPGAYGAFPWIDEERGYAGFLVIEATSVLGAELWTRTVGLVNEAIDTAR